MASLDDATTQAIHRIVRDYEAGAGPFTDTDRQLPIVDVTDDMEFPNERDKALFLTLSTAPNYMRDAQRLRERCRRLWETEHWIFEPSTLVGDDRYDDLLALFKGTDQYRGHSVLQRYGLMERGKRDVDIWYTVAYTLYTEYQSSPLVLIKEFGYDAVDLFNHIQSASYPRPVHPKSGTSKKFPYLGGGKIGPLWLRIIHEMVHPLDNIGDIEGIPIPVDVHVTKVTNYLIGTNLTAESDRDTIQELWKSFCKQADLATVQVDKPIWILGTLWENGGREYAQRVLAETETKPGPTGSNGREQPDPTGAGSELDQATDRKSEPEPDLEPTSESTGDHESDEQSADSDLNRSILLKGLLVIEEAIGRTPQPKDLPEESPVTIDDYRSEFDSWEAALQAAGLLVENPTEVTSEHLPPADTAWKTIYNYAKKPETTIRTAQQRSENKIGVESTNEIYFQKRGRTKRIVPRAEFEDIWNRLLRNGGITRKEVGDITSARAGSALFGALYDLYDLELDNSSQPLRLIPKKTD